MDGHYIEGFGHKRKIQSKWSAKDRKAFKRFVVLKLKKEKIGENIYNYFVITFVLGIFGLAIYLDMSIFKIKGQQVGLRLTVFSFITGF